MQCYALFLRPSRFKQPWESRFKPSLMCPRPCIYIQFFSAFRSPLPGYPPPLCHSPLIALFPNLLHEIQKSNILCLKVAIVLLNRGPSDSSIKTNLNLHCPLLDKTCFHNLLKTLKPFECENMWRFRKITYKVLTFDEKPNTGNLSIPRHLTTEKSSLQSHCNGHSFSAWAKDNKTTRTSAKLSFPKIIS